MYIYIVLEAYIATDNKDNDALGTPMRIIKKRIAVNDDIYIVNDVDFTH